MIFGLFRWRKKSEKVLLIDKFIKETAVKSKSHASFGHATLQMPQKCVMYVKIYTIFFISLPLYRTTYLFTYLDAILISGGTRFTDNFRCLHSMTAVCPTFLNNVLLRHFTLFLSVWKFPLQNKSLFFHVASGNLLLTLILAYTMLMNVYVQWQGLWHSQKKIHVCAMFGEKI